MALSALHQPRLRSGGRAVSDGTVGGGDRAVPLAGQAAPNIKAFHLYYAGPEENPAPDSGRLPHQRLILVPGLENSQ